MSDSVLKMKLIALHLREIDVMLSQGGNVADVIREIDVSKITYYRWRREFGGLKVDQARLMKDLWREKMRLKKRVADPSLDNSILEETASGNFLRPSTAASLSARFAPSLACSSAVRVASSRRSAPRNGVVRSLVLTSSR